MTQPLFEPTIVDIIVLQGSRYKLRVDLTCDWETDLTSWTIKAQIRDSRAPGATMLQDIASLVTIPAPIGPPMQVLLDIAADSSSAWTWDQGEYDIEVHHPSDAHRTLRVVQGHISINTEVSL